MLDIKVIRENPAAVKEKLATKGFDGAKIDTILELDTQVRELQGQIDTLRAERNQVAAQGPGMAEKGREIKQKIEAVNDEFTKVSIGYQALMLEVPNLPSDDTPIGKDDSENPVIRTVGDKTEFSFEPKDHMALSERLDLFDTERAAKVAGSRFTYLKNEAVMLEFSLIQLAMQICQKHGFKPMITPEMVNEKTVMGTGYLPAGADEVYKTQDDLYLIGTSELALIGYHQDELIQEAQLPIRYVGFSSCFRREAGSYGKDTKGILRLHQFDKVEMVSFVTPDKAEEEHQLLLSIEEEIMQALQIPYHVIQAVTADLGVQAAKKFDIEAWIPSQQKYRETHSTSNTTDFQSRRLNIRYKDAEGKNSYLYTLNGTAIAIGRMLIAIVENYQQEDGSVKVPDVLVPFTGFTEIK
jgi:seryl-tRNA synthetase